MMKATERTARGRVNNDDQNYLDMVQVGPWGCHPSLRPLGASVSKGCTHSRQREDYLLRNMRVPVLDLDNKPLMPAKASRARRWIAEGQATPFWNKGIWCVRLKREPSDRKFQKLYLGIDPGGSYEAYTLASHQSVLLDILTNTPWWVSKHMETRRNARRARRFRKTPCRQPRWNRLANKKRLPPSTKARWQAKLRIIKWLAKMFPITDVVVEDIAAKARKGQKKWNVSFSPLQIGKKWLYSRIKKDFALHLKQGYETYTHRQRMDYKKWRNKKSSNWEAHNVDSHSLCEIIVGKRLPTNKLIIEIKFLRFHRRQLHMLQPAKGGVRRRQGGTRSLGLKRGTFIQHTKHGLCYVGGHMKSRISLHNMQGKRVTQSANTSDCKIRAFASWAYGNLKGLA